MKGSRARFSSEQVLTIRTLHAGGVSQTELARRYGVKQATICRIVHDAGYGQRGVPHGKGHPPGVPMSPVSREKLSRSNTVAWKDETLIERHRARKIELRDQGVNTKLSPDDVQDIRNRLARGERGVDIARHYNVSEATISRIKQRNRWKDAEAG